MKTLLEDLRGQEAPAKPPFRQPKVTNIQQAGEPTADDCGKVENDETASNIITRKVEQKLKRLEELESNLGSIQPPIVQVSKNQQLSENLLAESVLECSRDAIAVLDGSPGLVLQLACGSFVWF